MEVQDAQVLPEKEDSSFFWVDSYRGFLERNVKQYISTRTELFPPGTSLCYVDIPAFRRLEEIVCKLLVEQHGTTYPIGEAKEVYEERVGDLVATLVSDALKN